MAGPAPDEDGARFTRRETLASLGVVGLGATGGYLVTSDDTADAAAVQNAAVGTLPGVSYEENVKSLGYEQIHVDGEVDYFVDTVYDLTVTRGLQLTNVRFYGDDDVANESCGDATGIEYRFVAAAVVKPINRYRENRGDEFQLESAHYDVLGDSDPLLSLSTDDACGTASLHSHYTNVETVDDTYERWFAESSEAARTEDEYESRLETVPVDRVDTFVGAAEALGELAAASPSVDLDHPVWRSGSKLLGVGGFLWDTAELIGMLYGGQDDDEPYGEATFEKTALEIAGGNTEGLTYVSDFTVTVPADANAATTVDVEQSFDYDDTGLPSPKSKFLQSKLGGEIEIPPNDPSAPLADFDLPRIALERDALADGDDTDPRILASPADPAVGEEVTFEQPDNAVGDPSDEAWHFSWRIAGEEYDGDAARHAFDAPGEYEAVLVVEEDRHADGFPEYETTYSRRIRVGEDPHLRPVAAFNHSPSDVEVGDTVRLNAGPTETHGYDASYDWVVHRIQSNDAYQPGEQELSGEDPEFDVSPGERYHVELVVRDGRGYADRTSQVIDPDQTPVADVAIEGETRVGEEVTFDASGSTPTVGEIVAYEWRIVDPPPNSSVPPSEIATYEGQTATHTFEAATEYHVSLTVENERELTDGVSRTVDVGPERTATPDGPGDDTPTTDDPGTDAPPTEDPGTDVPTTDEPVAGTIPQDPDDDGVYEDLNGNGRIESDDVVVYFENYDEPPMHDNPDLFDLNDNGRTDADDVVTLFESL